MLPKHFFIIIATGALTFASAPQALAFDIRQFFNFGRSEETIQKSQPQALPDAQGGASQKIIIGENRNQKGIVLKNFVDIRDELVSQKKDFIEINLPEMKTRLWKRGSIDEEFKIVARGNEPMWQGTPAGIYNLENKIRAAFSVTEDVFMPYALQIYGSMWMHGIPYYADNKKLNSYFSHGCVRLADADIPIIFKKAKLGMIMLPIDSQRDQYLYPGDRKIFAPQLPATATSESKERLLALAMASSSKNISEPFVDIALPRISSDKFLAADIKNDYVLLSKNARQPAPIYYLTKMMSSLVIIEHISLRRVIGIDKEILDSGQGETKGIEKDARLHAIDLLIPMLMESSNDAAQALARFLGREQSVKLMNEKAKAILMDDSSFVDAAGQSEKNISSARDLYYLSKYIFYNMSPLYKISSNREAPTLGDTKLKKEDYRNQNIFAGNLNFLGGHASKIGNNKDNGMFVFSFFDKNKQKRYVSIILLESSDLKGDVEKINRWIQDNYNFSFNY